MTKIKIDGKWIDVANLGTSDVIRNPDWSRAVQVTSAQINAGYTVPDDGIMTFPYILPHPQGTTQTVQMFINDIPVSSSYTTSGADQRPSTLCLPVSKGDVIRLNSGGAIGETSNHFVPYKITSAAQTVLEAIYPVGSIYINTNDVNPADFLKFGTWVRVAAGKALWGASEDGQAGGTKNAGLPNITGSINLMPGTVGAADDTTSGMIQGSGAFITNAVSTATWRVQSNIPVASYKAIKGVQLDARRSNNIYGGSTTVQPPALVVNIWQRTA